MKSSVTQLVELAPALAAVIGADSVHTADAQLDAYSADTYWPAIAARANGTPLGRPDVVAVPRTEDEVPGARGDRRRADRLEPLNRFETYFLNRCEQALALADAVGGDCGVALDAFHMNIEESDLLAAIRAAGDRLVDFHVADNNRMPPGHGAVDWEAIVRELVGVGYEGHMTVEFVASVDRSAISQREIGDASEAGGGAAMEKFVRDHSTGAVPESYYDRYAEESVTRLRAAFAADKAPAV